MFSFAQESTRYCNYSKDKFNNELTFIIPCWITDSDIKHYKRKIESSDFFSPNKDSTEGSFSFLFSLEEIESIYLSLVKEEGWKPQQARAILPNSLKTELVMTGFVDDWWGEYLVIDKATGLVDQIIHGKFYDELNNIDRDKYRIVEKGFFPLRCSSGAHPQAQELAIPLREEFINKKIW